MKFTQLFSIVLAVALIPITAFADNGHGKNGDKGNKGNGSHIKVDLLPSDATQLDLVSARGKVHLRLKNHGKSFLQIKVKLPYTSTTLGILDDATAAAADIHVEFSRDTDADSIADTIIDDCALTYRGVSDDGDDLDDSGDERKYDLKIRQKGTNSVQNQFGSCGGSSLPALEATDTMRVYAILGDLTQVNFMADE